MKRIILWIKDHNLLATEMLGSPKELFVEGVKFDVFELDLGDVDYLRNSDKRIVGFAYSLGNSEAESALARALARQCDKIKEKDGSLYFLLSDESFEFDIVQAIGTVIYHDHAGHHVFSIPDWGFGELGFRIVTGEMAPRAT